MDTNDCNSKNFYIVLLFLSRRTKREKTKMRMVRNFEHISGMLRQQSKLTKNDGNHERNKKLNVFEIGKKI